ncbi:MAG: 3,4-dihydroxy-2-butanone-4-phosphate synthase [Succinivibrionaceae bacterium]|nr:3,4-dihydroxy-2-butanone-4-phosphate synthase [Succinivibrionaceae bacterium]
MTRTSLLSTFGADSNERVEAALEALRERRGIMVVDNEDRENEGDLIYAADTVTEDQMAFLIRECSGIMCVCVTEERARALGLTMMVSHNTSAYGTAFTISVDAAHGVGTGVSAHDRVATVRTLVDPSSTPQDLVAPGHTFPLVARPGGVLERGGHTEASVDLARLAGFSPAGILCELCAPDGNMAKLPRVCTFAMLHDLTVVSIDDLIAYRRQRGV